MPTFCPPIPIAFGDKDEGVSSCIGQLSISRSTHSFHSFLPVGRRRQQNSMMMLPLAFLLASFVAAQDCWTNNCTNPITLVPAPWTIYGTGYVIPLLPVLPGTLPLKTYGPLERSSSEATAGIYTGLAGAIQIIRYSDTPVGPYDEFVLIPGAFTYDRLGTPRINLRVTRMYVSQKYTCYNGRASMSSISVSSIIFPILNSA